jgi:hypothetical protein
MVMLYFSKNASFFRAMIYLTPVSTILFMLVLGVVPRTGIIDTQGLLYLTVFVFSSCIVLFWLRERHRLIYGLLEIAFSLLLVWGATIKIGTLSGAVVAAWSFGNDGIYALAGALYVGVRALDNIGQAIDRYPRIYEFWLWFFHYPRVEAGAKQEAARRKWETKKQSDMRLYLDSIGRE